MFKITIHSIDDFIHLFIVIIDKVLKRPESGRIGVTTNVVS